MANTRRIVGIGITLALIAAAGGGGWYWYQHKNQAVTYRTAPVTRGPLIQAVTATGTLNPVVNIQVGSQISGIIEKLAVDWNSPVTNGQVIAQIDASTFKASVRQAEGDLANVRAALELAKINAERAQKLRAADLIAQADCDQALASLHQAEAVVMIRDAALERSRIDLARTTIYAPVDGVVISRNVDVGQTVAASLSAPTLFVIANDLAKMQIDANVAEADVGGIEIGDAVNFTVDAFPSRTFRGKVSQVRNAPTTVQNVVTYDTVIDVNNADLKLKPGMTANVSIIIDQRDDVLKVANAAFRFRPPEVKKNGKPGAADKSTAKKNGGARGGQRSDAVKDKDSRAPGAPADESHGLRTVYVSTEDADDADRKTDQPLKPVQIKTGITDGINTEVLSGLDEDDEVVLGVSQSSGNAAGTPPPGASPFGGGMRRM